MKSDGVSCFGSVRAVHGCSSAEPFILSESRLSKVKGEEVVNEFRHGFPLLCCFLPDLNCSVLRSPEGEIL
jgi:hypothetical protein